ncbi:unnamed protein product [Gordionus sp. m RMFG-2023]
MSNLYSIGHLINISNNVTSSLYDRCVSFDNTVLFVKEDIMTEVNLVTGYIILILGIIGNILAIIANKAMKSRLNSGQNTTATSPNVSRFILKWFSIFSLITVLTEIVSPIMKIHGDTICCQTFWNSKRWNVHLANVHYPITKTLMSFSFFIYLIFFGVQMLAVKFPTNFKSVVSKRRVVWVMAMSFVYSVAWYAPAFKWFYITKVLLCPKGPYLKRYFKSKTIFEGIEEADLPLIYVYNYEIYKPSAREKFAWQTYEILRELCVYIIPFFVLITIKKIVAHKRHVTSIFKVNNSVTPSGPEDRTKYIKKFDDPGSLSTIKMKTKEQMDLELERNRLRKNRMKEREQHSKTLIILTIQFVIFLLPISLMEIVTDHLQKTYNKRTITHLYIFLNALQYMYFSLTFYINLSFNSIYRENVFNSFKRLLIKKYMYR